MTENELKENKLTITKILREKKSIQEAQHLNSMSPEKREQKGITRKVIQIIYP